MDNGRWRQATDPDTLKAISNLQLRVRRVVEGLQGGAHPSLHFGASVEFAEHKKYSPGDDIRHIDWRALARTDRYFIKQHQREVILSCVLVLDCSPSMGYKGSRAYASKIGYAVELLAAMAYLLVRQGDAAGLLAFAEKPERFIAPRRRPDQLATLMRYLSTVEVAPGGRTNYAEAVSAIAGHERQRGLIILASDLWGADQETERVLGQLSARGHDIAVFHVLDPDEIDLPFPSPLTLEGMEGDGRIEVDPVLIREDYRDEVQSVIEGWRRFCGKAGIDYLTSITGTPPAVMLSEFASRRQGAGRVR